MTKDEIIRMARKAGGADISSNGWTSWVGTQSTEFLERFANLVAEHEREACAKVCEAGINNATDWDNSYWDQCCENRAAAIRARSQT